MEKGKQKALEAVGFRVGGVKEFLGLTEEENQLIELRVAVSRGVRTLRERRHLTQKELAAILHSTQPRVARLESASPDVSLDQMFRGFFAVGGKLSDLALPSGSDKTRKAAKPRKKSVESGAS